MVFTIITYYNHVRRHLYGVYHTINGVYQPITILLEGTSMVFTIIT